MCCNKVIRIFDQLLLSERIDQTRDGVCADEGQYKAADALDQRMSPFQQDTDLKIWWIRRSFIHSSSEPLMQRRRTIYMDQAFTQWINSIAGSNALLDSVMIAASKVGVPPLVALVVAQWWSKIDRTISTKDLRVRTTNMKESS